MNALEYIAAYAGIVTTGAPALELRRWFESGVRLRVEATADMIRRGRWRAAIHRASTGRSTFCCARHKREVALKSVIGWLTSQTLYWLGHLASKSFTNRQAVAYPIYKRLMVCSSNVDEWAGCGLWKRGKDIE